MAESNATTTYTFAYYCSGHGYGHATRVVALTHELLTRSHRVHICTNAPEYVFTTAIASGAQYRHAEIDAGIVQPKAYDVARRQTVDGLKRFLGKRDVRLQEEAAWLKSIKADAVLVDAPFLPCAAAKLAGIPAVIVSNFTFDSCYSYLSVSVEAQYASLPSLRNNSTSSTTSVTSATTDLQSLSLNGKNDDPPEAPIPADLLEPLVNQATQDYANASLLLRLPGSIPIPAFDLDVPLPAPLWTNLSAHSFGDDILDLLGRDTSTIPCNTSNQHISLSTHTTLKGKKRQRRAVQVPLITRPISEDIYTSSSRSLLLSSLGVPADQHDPSTTKILVVSFGGQSIPRPPSRPATPHRASGFSKLQMASTGISDNESGQKPVFTNPFAERNGRCHETEPRSASMQRLMTKEHLYLPGAPPALHQVNRRPSSQSSQISQSSRHARKHSRKISLTTNTIFIPPPPGSTDFVPESTNVTESAPEFEVEVSDDNLNELLPRDWIAIVCGLSNQDLEEELPPNFYAAPRDVYVPDLTATCDVLLGKLVRLCRIVLMKHIARLTKLPSIQGYGTCSETVYTQTPFVYVPRPLFVEEFGLKRLMETSGTAIPMTRSDFEGGKWRETITQAHELGRAKKEAHRRQHQSRSDPEVKAATTIAKEIENFMDE